MRSRIELLRTLAVYERARAQLVADFVQEEPELYHSMFEFQPHSAAMRLAVERYIVLWLMQHANFYQKLFLIESDAEPRKQDALFVKFMDNYYKYCKNFLSIRKGKNEDALAIGYDFLKHRIGFLDDLLEVNQKANSRLKHIRYQNSKARAFYEKQFAELRRQKDVAGNT